MRRNLDLVITRNLKNEKVINNTYVQRQFASYLILIVQNFDSVITDNLKNDKLIKKAS